VFESGSRGQFGVGEYRFDLEQSNLIRLQKTITGHTGAKFSTKIPASKVNSVEKVHHQYSCNRTVKPLLDVYQISVHNSLV